MLNGLIVYTPISHCYRTVTNTSKHASSQEKEDILEHFKSVNSHVGMQVTMFVVLQIVIDQPNSA